MLSCRMGSPSGFPVATSHSPQCVGTGRHHPRPVGTEDSGENKAIMPHRLPQRLARRRVPQCAVLSALAVTTRVPSGLKAAEKTAPSCRIGSPSGLPVAASHSRAVMSELAVSTRVPSRLKAVR